MSTFVFNFQRRFAESVRSGRKYQTIRAERKDKKRPEVGDTVKLFTGMRTKQCELLRTGRVIRVRSIRIVLSTGAIYYGVFRLKGAELEHFAQLDGFDSFDSLMTWLRDTHGDDEFNGFCTCWEPL